MFAKLFTTAHGQFLVLKVDETLDGEPCAGIELRYEAGEVAAGPFAGSVLEARRFGWFTDEADDDDNRLKRDAAFDGFDQEQADETAAATNGQGKAVGL